MHDEVSPEEERQQKHQGTEGQYPRHLYVASLEELRSALVPARREWEERLAHDWQNAKNNLVHTADRAVESGFFFTVQRADHDLISLVVHVGCKEGDEKWRTLPNQRNGEG